MGSCCSSASVAVAQNPPEPAPQSHSDSPSLVTIPFLADLKPKDIRKLEAIFTRKTYQAGEFITKEGDQDNKFFIIITGRVNLYARYTAAQPVGEESEPASPSSSSALSESDASDSVSSASTSSATSASSISTVMVASTVTSSVLQSTGVPLGERVVLREMSAGQWLGEMMLLDDEREDLTSVDVQAVTDTTLLEVDSQSFSAFLEQNPDASTSVEEIGSLGSMRVQLRSLPFFANVPEIKLQHLGRLLEFRRIEAGNVLCKEGDAADGFYIVIKGSLQVTCQNLEDGENIFLETLGRGAYFGETSLLEDLPRTATITATSDSVLLYLNHDRFKSFLKIAPEVRSESFAKIIKQRTAHMLRAIPFFSLLHTKQVGALQRFDERKMSVLGGLFTYEKVAKGVKLIEEGQTGDAFYVIVRGSLTVSSTSPSGESVTLATLKAGGVCGELALLENMPRTATIQALEDCLVLKMTAEKFSHFLVVAPELRASMEHMLRYKKTTFLEKIPIFARIQENRPWSKASLLGDLFQFFYVKERGHVLMREGDDADKFYVVVSGSVRVVQTSVGKKLIVDAATAAAAKASQAAENNGDSFQSQRSSSIASTLASQAIPSNGMWGNQFGAGSFFGELALLGLTTKRSATVITNDATLLLYLTKEKFRTFLQVAPEMREVLEKRITNQMSDVSDLKFYGEVETVPVDLESWVPPATARGPSAEASDGTA